MLGSYGVGMNCYGGKVSNAYDPSTPPENKTQDLGLNLFLNESGGEEPGSSPKP